MSNMSVTRRDLVEDAALGAAAVGILAGASTALADEATEVKNSSSWVKATQNVTWDEEARHRHLPATAWRAPPPTSRRWRSTPTCDVAIYDTSDPEANAGGQAVASGQCVIFAQPEDIETFRTYMRSHERAAGPMPEEDMLLADRPVRQRHAPGFRALLEPAGYEVGYSGGGALRYGTLLVEFPDLEGADFVGATGHFRKKDGGKPFENGGCWNGMAAAAEVRGAKPNYQHQASPLWFRMP